MHTTNLKSPFELFATAFPIALYFLSDESRVPLLLDLLDLLEPPSSPSLLGFAASQRLHWSRRAKLRLPHLKVKCKTKELVESWFDNFKQKNFQFSSEITVEFWEIVPSIQEKSVQHFVNKTNWNDHVFYQWLKLTTYSDKSNRQRRDWTALSCCSSSTWVFRSQITFY